ncbi:MAG: DUF4845 domain-containing protein [Gammaproteobacteria bacterium]|nr:MAG: DUF4845 domain-containing protein [Gammaproteobacteria bacterium]
MHLHRQAGMSFLGWLIVLVIAVLLGTAAIRLAPVYLQYYSLVSILEELEQDPELANADAMGIRRKFSNFLDVNQIDLPKDAYRLERGDKGWRLVLAYEERRPLIGNIDLVVRFEREAKIGGRGP